MIHTFHITQTSHSYIFTQEKMIMHVPTCSLSHAHTHIDTQLYLNVYSSFIHNCPKLQTTQMSFNWWMRKQTGTSIQWDRTPWKQGINYSGPLISMGLNCTGLLACQFFPSINTVLHSLPLVESEGVELWIQKNLKHIGWTISYTWIFRWAESWCLWPPCCSRVKCLDTHNIYNNSGDES